MSEIREKAVRLLLQAAYEMAADNADSVADIFDCQHGFIDDLRRRAMLKLDKPYTAPDFDTAEQQIAETGEGDGGSAPGPVHQLLVDARAAQDHAGDHIED